ncbi:MAG: Citrate carrier [Alphaproteobacteria bacterium MarineAlpha11_Bin1]|nr:MAG: Citrate carrier [Alphaproteobacteria bacterium MarineAlpha11_Bin1]|tara:strand:- start:3548 stop:4933 length:1386 start_codon:yes stop_codon:yes gene_type:complete
MEKKIGILPAAVTLVGLLLGAFLWLQPPPDGTPPDIMRIAAVVVISVSLWASGVVPEYFTAIIFFFLAMVLTDAGAPTVFSGFNSTAVWMIFGGLIVGAAVQETGFGHTLASRLLKIFPRNYFGILCGITVVGTVLCFIIPSNTGRIVIMMPIFMALADQVGFEPGSRGRTGMGLAVAAGSIYPSLSVLPAAVPNLAWLGATESIHGIKFTYAEYLIANFPVIGIVSMISIPIVCRTLYADRIENVESVLEPASSSSEQTRLILVLTTALGLWLTDFAHGVSPAWVALGAAVICMLPRVGMVPASFMVGKVSYAPWFFVAGVIGMGALVADAGLGAFISLFLFDIVPLNAEHNFLNFVIVGGVGSAMGLLTTVPGQPAIMTTIATEIAAATGWPLRTVLLTQPLNWAMAMFAYQFPPFVLAAHLGGISASQMVRLILVMCSIAWIIMMPLLYLWWSTLGYF